MQCQFNVRNSLPKACSLPGKVLHKSRSSLNARAVEAAPAAMRVMPSISDNWFMSISIDRSRLGGSESD